MADPSSTPRSLLELLSDPDTSNEEVARLTPLCLSEFTALARRADPDAAVLAAMVRSAVRLARASRRELGDRVALVAQQPDLTQEHLLDLADALARRVGPEPMRVAAPALLAHPACTDEVAAALLGSPWSADALRRTLRGVASGVDLLEIMETAVAALMAANHPVAGAIAVLAHGPTLDSVTTWRLVKETACLRADADRSGVLLPELTAALLRLAPDWTGAPHELRDCALAVLTDSPRAHR